MAKPENDEITPAEEEAAFQGPLTMEQMREDAAQKAFKEHYPVGENLEDVLEYSEVLPRIVSRARTPVAPVQPGEHWAPAEGVEAKRDAHLEREVALNAREQGVAPESKDLYIEQHVGLLKKMAPELEDLLALEARGFITLDSGTKEWMRSSIEAIQPKGLAELQERATLTEAGGDPLKSQLPTK